MFLGKFFFIRHLYLYLQCWYQSMSIKLFILHWSPITCPRWFQAFHSNCPNLNTNGIKSRQSFAQFVFLFTKAEWKASIFDNNAQKTEISYCLPFNISSSVKSSYLFALRRITTIDWRARNMTLCAGKYYKQILEDY